MFLLVSIAIVQSAPPVKTTIQSTYVSEGIQITYPLLDYWKLGREYEFHIHLFNISNFPMSGNNASCIMHIYNESGYHVLDQPFLIDDKTVEYELLINSTVTSIRQRLGVLIYCHGNNTFNRDYGFVRTSYDVTGSGKEDAHDTPVGVLVATISIPLIIALLFMFGAISIDAEEHRILRIFLFLLAFVPIFTAFQFASISIASYYNVEQLGDAVADTVYWFGIIFGVIITYFIIYLIVKALAYAAQEKEEKREM